MYVFLNTRLPPFNNLKARQAVNYAVDRNRMVELSDLDAFQPTCQVLPPNFDGYRRYCPYTIDPRSDGKYTGPDLAKARQLVAASGTSGQAVTIWSPASVIRGGKPIGRYFVSILESLGYKARLKLIPGGNQYFAIVSDSRRKVQAGYYGWNTDYLSASGFFSPILTCAPFQPRSTHNQNWAEFCNPRIDAEIASAGSLQTSDPPAAAQLWSKIDRDIVDQAAWIAFMTLQLPDFVSRRVGNYEYKPQWGALLDRIWVR